MRLIKMTGGLGNQMFIYAFYLQMKERFPQVHIDLSDMVHYNVHHGYELNRVFNLPRTEFCINQSLKKVIEFMFFKTIIERKQNGSLKAYNKSYIWPLIYFKGFYQSEKYFTSIKKKVHDTFTFDKSIANQKTIALLKQMDADKDSISIHIRRGDYLLPKHWKTTGSVCQLPYYLNAIAEMERKIKTPSYYVFSDDITWVKENIPLAKAIYIDWNKGEDSWQDMMLMSHCRHHIICNSTFSWWGAWLNPHKDKTVIAPNRWFQHCETPDIYPEGWIKIPISSKTK